MVGLLEMYPKLLLLDAVAYVNAVNNLLNMTAHLDNKEEQTYYLNRLFEMMRDAKLKKNNSLQIKVFQAYYYHRITSFIKGDFEQGLPCVYEMEKGLKNYADEMDEMGQVMLCFYSFHIAFGAAKYTYAMKWLNRILAYQNHNIRQDIYCFTNILKLVTACELNDLNVLKKVTPQVYAFLYKKEQQYKIETITLDFIQNMKCLTNKNKVKAAFVQLQNKLIQLNEDPFEKKTFAYFDFIVWTHSKITGKSFANIIKNGVTV